MNIMLLRILGLNLGELHLEFLPAELTDWACFKQVPAPPPQLYRHTEIKPAVVTAWWDGFHKPVWRRGISGCRKAVSWKRPFSAVSNGQQPTSVAYWKWKQVDVLAGGTLGALDFLSTLILTLWSHAQVTQRPLPTQKIFPHLEKFFILAMFGASLMLRLRWG